MKNCILLLFLFFSITALTQTLEGLVVGSDTKPLPGANVYFDHSSLATITDNDGNFKFEMNSKLNLALVVSYVGYKTQYIPAYDVSEKLYIVLEEEQNKLSEVKIVGNQLFTRKDKLKIFREQFLGTSKASKKTIIENEDAIHFSYDKTSNTLHAYSEVPLQISNPYLGYKITYELSSFDIAFKKLSIATPEINSIYYSGFSRFEELVSNKETAERRQDNYNGSILHFFRSLAGNDLYENKFLIYKEGQVRNPPDCFAIKDTLGMKEVKVKKLGNKDQEIFYNILYNGKERSRLSFKTDTFFIDYLGNFSSLEKIFFLGEFGSKRVGNQLPLNYGIQ